MNFTPRPLPKHRRARLVAWTLAMLMWMAQVLFGVAAFAGRHERQRGQKVSLAWLTHMAKALIISRAADLASPRWRKRYDVVRRGRDIAPRAVIRALIGSRVRRMLKHKEVSERILVLIDAIQHLDRYAALVAKRLRGGLTRRRLAQFALPPTPPAPLVTLARTPAFCVDSS